MAVNLWKSTVYGSIINFASLTSMGQEVVETSVADGANAWQRIRRIYLPHLRPTFVILLLFSLGGILRGLSRATLVTRRDPVQILEMLVDDRPAGSKVPYIGSPGSRLTGQVPARYGSACWIETDARCNRFLLSMEGAECPTCVDLDGVAAG